MPIRPLPRPLPSLCALLGAVLLALAACSSHDGTDAGLGEGKWASLISRDSLWHNVQQRCLQPAPAVAGADCAVVDREHGFVLYKDAIGPSHYLVIPDHPVTGVDDPRVWADGAPNAWAFGWDARSIVGRSLARPLPDTLTGLAINARASRSQDQLHIHLDCISPAARDFLASVSTAPGWTDGTLRGRPVRSRFMPAEQPVLAFEPFGLVRDAQDASRQAVADRGIFVAWVQRPDGPRGFVVVDDPVDRSAGRTGHASDFLDRRCALGQAASP